MVKQRSKAQRPFLIIAKDLYICAMPVTVQNQEINNKHLIDIVFPSTCNAEIAKRRSVVTLCLVISVQRYFMFASPFEILGRAKINFIRVVIYKNSRMKKPIMQMLDAQKRQKPIDNDFIDAFMPHNASLTVKPGKFVVQLGGFDVRIRLQKRTGRTGGFPCTRPAEAPQILQLFNNFSFHDAHFLLYCITLCI